MELFAYVSEDERLNRTACHIYEMPPGKAREICLLIGAAFQVRSLTTLSASHTPPTISKLLLETQRRARTCPLRASTRTNSGALVVHSTTLRALISSGLLFLLYTCTLSLCPYFNFSPPSLHLRTCSCPKLVFFFLSPTSFQVAEQESNRRDNPFHPESHTGAEPLPGQLDKALLNRKLLTAVKVVGKGQVRSHARTHTLFSFVLSVCRGAAESVLTQRFFAIRGCVF
jgi:hypothetical protein